MIKPYLNYQQRLLVHCETLCGAVLISKVYFLQISKLISFPIKHLLNTILTTWDYIRNTDQSHFQG